MSAAVIIPARYASTRFPGKPLHLIAGKPLIQHVWERCRQCRNISEIIVATDDDRIAAAARGFGAAVCMTSPDHQSGTDRIAEATRALPGATHVIIGHSERRTLFGETNESVNKKTHAAITGGLVPIVCIGETLDQRDRHETMGVLDRQIKEGLDRITGEQLSALVIAYEPVWAIGTGRNATPAQAGEAHFHIRQRLKQWFGLDASEKCRVLYGGSVKPDNIAKLIAEPDVDGALVGGASLDPKSFFAIISGAAPK